MKRLALVVFFVVLGLLAVAAGNRSNRRPIVTGSDVGGWIPITKTPETDGTRVGGGGARTQPGGPGANLYPRKAQPADTSFEYPLFPKDALYSFLKLDTVNLVGPVINDEARADWVLDTLDNSDTPRVVGSVAYGINAFPNLSDSDPTNDLKTGTTDPTSSSPRVRGHWPGLRVVDGIGTTDQTIFSGGKENNVNTWKIVPGSVGSAKFDITQAYVAESTYRTDDLSNYPDGIKSVLMFGVERRDNGGTTAFDLEINKLQANNNLIPNRSLGDVLVSVELGSPTAPPKFFIFVWDGLKYAPFNISTLPEFKQPVVTTNLVNTPSAPWGFVNGKGQWVVGQLPPSCFAEVLLPISEELSLLNHAAGDTTSPLFMQIRTRSSVSDTSDLKDLTTYFLFAFGGPTATMNVRSNCSQGLTYWATWPGPVGDGPYRWQFGPDAGTSLSSADPEFGFDPEAPGDPSRYAGQFPDFNARSVTANLPTGAPYVDCDVYLTVSPVTPNEFMLFDVVRIYRSLAATATLTQSNLGPKVFNYSSSAVGGLAPYSYSWSFINQDNIVVGTSNTASGTFDTKKNGTYRAVLTLTDTGDVDKDVCNIIVNSNTITFGGPG